MYIRLNGMFHHDFLMSRVMSLDFLFVHPTTQIPKGIQFTRLQQKAKSRHLHSWIQWKFGIWPKLLKLKCKYQNRRKII